MPQGIRGIGEKFLRDGRLYVRLNHVTDEGDSPEASFIFSGEEVSPH
jgi:hypothetical protein